MRLDTISQISPFVKIETHEVCAAAPLSDIGPTQASGDVRFRAAFQGHSGHQSVIQAAWICEYMPQGAAFFPTLFPLRGFQMDGGRR